MNKLETKHRCLLQFPHKIWRQSCSYGFGHTAIPHCIFIALREPKLVWVITAQAQAVASSVYIYKERERWRKENKLRRPQEVQLQFTFSQNRGRKLRNHCSGLLLLLQCFLNGLVKKCNDAETEKESPQCSLTFHFKREKPLKMIQLFVVIQLQKLLESHLTS